MADERLAPPVLRDEGKKAMLDTVPFAGPRRVVGDCDGQSGFIGEGLKLTLPQPDTSAVAAAAISGDKQAGRAEIAALSQGIPPAPDALNGEGSGVVIDANIHPTRVVGNVVDAVRSNLAEFGYLEVMNAYRLRIAFGPKLTPAVLEIADQFLLFRINRDGGLPGSLELLDLLIDVLELGVTVGMERTFQGFLVGLKTEAKLAQQPANQFLTGCETAFSQCTTEVALASAHPQQRRFGITACR